MRSVLPITLGKDEARYVEYGFARFVDSETKSVAVDEPLVLLAATQWINMHHRSSYKHFAKHIHLNEQHSNGFENYLAFCIDMAFSHRRRLNEVFAFLGSPPSWSGQEAELVALYNNNSLDVDVDISTNQHFLFSGPSVTLGTNAKSLDETSHWLNHKNHSPICFPHHAMGPDLIFILRLADGSLIWVVLQAKYSGGKNGTLSRAYLRHAMRSVTPSLFFLDKARIMLYASFVCQLMITSTGRRAFLAHKPPVSHHRHIPLPFPTPPSQNRRRAVQPATRHCVLSCRPGYEEVYT